MGNLFAGGEKIKIGINGDTQQDRQQNLCEQQVTHSTIGNENSFQQQLTLSSIVGTNNRFCKQQVTLSTIGNENSFQQQVTLSKISNKNRFLQQVTISNKNRFLLQESVHIWIPYI
ncbi:uncharacterized protein LOC116131749 isoform X11 [Pistacia vera]|uniref:uncharacterized protein LOC116131749 isoform X11 n=1 Tax=Pistacia vera TaxID=55513 RepID=UPI00126342D2|nr:uncharacterized protein LOC116131749 isoform X11 [Pistacia vera]